MIVIWNVWEEQPKPNYWEAPVKMLKQIWSGQSLSGVSKVEIAIFSVPLQLTFSWVLVSSCVEILQKIFLRTIKLIWIFKPLFSILNTLTLLYSTHINALNRLLVLLDTRKARGKLFIFCCINFLTSWFLPSITS